MSHFQTIENFLPKKEFEALMSSLNKLFIKGHDFLGSTAIESNKEVFRMDEIEEDIFVPISIIAGDKGKQVIRSLTGWNGEMISLLELKNFGGYAPLHNMISGGFLGSHIDHTYANGGNLIHIGNSIFYATYNWENNWGGETCFFDNSGFAILHTIKPSKNMLLGFVHDCESFHGVNRISCPPSEQRTTIYMDYYIKAEDLDNFKSIYLKTSGKKFLYCKYLTTFIPFGRKGNFLASIFSKNFFGYLRNYLGYLDIKERYVGGTKINYLILFTLKILNIFLVIGSKLKRLIT